MSALPRPFPLPAPDRLVAWFAALPRPLQGLSTALLAAMFVSSLLFPDPVLLLDEAALAVLAASAAKAFLRGSPPPASLATPVEVIPAAGPAGPALPSLRPVPAPVAALRGALTEVAAAATALEDEGLGPRGLLAELSGGLADLLAELDAHEAFFSRKDHDPWWVDRGVRTARGGEAAGRAQALRDRVAERLAQREELLARLGPLAAQIEALRTDLLAVRAQRGLGALAVEAGALDALLAPVPGRLRGFDAARRELEATTRRRTGG